MYPRTKQQKEPKRSANEWSGDYALVSNSQTVQPISVERCGENGGVRNTAIENCARGV